MPEQSPLSESTILVVDDNPGARYAVCRSLEAAGFKTVSTAGGAEALHVAATQSIAAVVLDVHLPDLHGFEVCRLLRGKPATAHIPIVHVSAVHVSDADRATGLSSGADAYYVSPVEPGLLVATLRGLIRSRKSADTARDMEQRYRGAFDAAPTGLAVVNADGEIEDVNRAFLALLQTGRTQLLRKPITTLVPPEWVVSVESARFQWKTRPWTGHFPVVGPGGTRIALTWSCAPHPEPGWSVVSAEALGDVLGNSLRPPQ